MLISNFSSFCINVYFYRIIEVFAQKLKTLVIWCRHLGSKSEHWQAEYNLLMQGVEESKMKMTLNVQHNMNYHNIPEMATRKSQLLTDLVKICQDLKIKNLVIPPL